MTTQDITASSREIKGLIKLAKHLGIDPEDADTLVSEIIPILKRKLDLLSRASNSSGNLEGTVQKILQEEVPIVLSNYALGQLRSNKSALLFLAKKISPAVTDLRAKQLVDRLVLRADRSLADQLAAQLGIRDTHVQDFNKKVLPKIKKYTKAMYRKKIQNGDAIDNSEAFDQFIIDNVFIDEFENHFYIRSATDDNNRAILLPEAKMVALKMLSAWKNEIKGEGL